MKRSLEVTKNSEGRIESGILYSGKSKILEFVNNWDDDGFLRNVEFKGKNSALPTNYETLKYLNDKFIERIRRIDLIDEITLIEEIDRVNAVSIEAIASLPNITVLGDLGAALGQTAPVAAAYFSPTGVAPPFVGWVDVDDAFDVDLGTQAICAVGGMSWGNFLTLTFAATICDMLRIYAYIGAIYGHIIDIDVYRNGSWVHVYEGSFTNSVWIEHAFGQGSCTAVRVRFKNEDIADLYCSVMEIEMRSAASGSHLETAVISSTLPTGAATEATLSAAEVHAGSIDGKITACNTGAVVLAASNAAVGLAENQTYIPYQASLNADGNLTPATATHIRVHAIVIHATATVEGDIKDKSGGTAKIHFKLQDREGMVLPFAPYPAYWVKSQAAGDEPYVDFSTAAQCYFTIIYTENAA